jgi:hypothetical protein
MRIGVIQANHPRTTDTAMLLTLFRAMTTPEMVVYLTGRKRI